MFGTQPTVYMFGDLAGGGSVVLAFCVSDRGQVKGDTRKAKRSQVKLTGDK